jgi:mono/diheme cytochrome c family protein
MRPKATITVLLMLLAGFIIIDSCRQKPKSTSTGETSLAPTAAFEMDPPVATEIEIQALGEPLANGANILVKARFNDRRIQSQFHSLNVNDEPMMLRDDGKEGDEKAGDGLFTAALQDDVEALEKELTGLQERLRRAASNRKQFFNFVNRSPVPVDVKSFIERPINLKERFRFDARILEIDPPEDSLLDERSLMITHLGVVEDTTRTFNPCTLKGDSNGVWTFGRLMAEMANTPATGIGVDSFTRAWLRNWLVSTPINSDPVPARTAIFSSIIRPWVSKSNPGVPIATITLANWHTFPLRMKFAPFKLLAIVNRLDLRGNIGYAATNAGEGRFVFGALTSTCASSRFTVIFEYGIPKKKCADIKAFAQQWYNLKTLVPGTAAYNSALQAITDQFALAGKGGSKPNGSALNQLRTNEISLASPWELREFVVDGPSHLLAATTVKQEPAETFNRLGSPTNAARVIMMRDFVNDNEVAVKNNTYEVPLLLLDTPFLGGKAHTETPGHFWDAQPGQITNDTARHMFSLGTCSGCHGGEGRTTIGNLVNDPPGVPHEPFLHIVPKPFGSRTTLSAFLTGDPSQPDQMFNVSDPAGRTPVWKFNDILRRALDLQSLVNMSCRIRTLELIRTLHFKPVKMTH